MLLYFVIEGIGKSKSQARTDTAVKMWRATVTKSPPYHILSNAQPAPRTLNRVPKTLANTCMTLEPNRALCNTLSVAWCPPPTQPRKSFAPQGDGDKPRHTSLDEMLSCSQRPCRRRRCGKAMEREHCPTPEKKKNESTVESRRA